MLFPAMDVEDFAEEARIVGALDPLEEVLAALVAMTATFLH